MGGSVVAMSDLIRPMALDPGFDPRSDVFNRLLKNRVIMLGTDVNDDMANQICAQLLYLEGEEAAADIWLYINSPGGSVTAGMAIYDTMQFISCDVATVCMGMAASMGQFLLTAGAAGKRYTLPNAHHDAPAPRRVAWSGHRHRHPGRAARLHQASHGRADGAPLGPDARADPKGQRARSLVHGRPGKGLRSRRRGQDQARRTAKRLGRWGGLDDRPEVL